MIIINSVNEALRLVNDIKQSNKISLIPTMGNLHHGHLSLIQRASSETKRIVTIYVNRLQFDQIDDFKSYPKSYDHDIELCKKNNVDIVFIPNEEILIEESELKIDLPKFTKHLCGKYRKGHFLGVYKIIRELFRIFHPDFACFGKKDYQQLLLIKYITKTFYPDIKIISVDTVRNKNNIALSSRLNKLTPESLKKAEMIYNSISMIKDKLHNGKNFEDIKKETYNFLEENKISIEYIDHRSLISLEESHGKLLDSGIFIACNIDGIRLIDNIEI